MKVDKMCNIRFTEEEVIEALTNWFIAGPEIDSQKILAHVHKNNKCLDTDPETGDVIICVDGIIGE